MAHLNALGGLRKEFHHVKTLTGEGHEDYEPAMVLIRDDRPGRSFMVPLSAMWKYMEPKANKDVMEWDRKQFDELATKIYWRRKLSIGHALQQANEDAAAIVFAESLSAGSGVLLCTGFSLFKACQLLDITVSSQALVQLMLFIQDGLDDLKAMKPAEAENKREIGEAIIRIDGKTYHVPAEMTETDQAQDVFDSGS